MRNCNFLSPHLGELHPSAFALVTSWPIILRISSASEAFAASRCSRASASAARSACRAATAFQGRLRVVHNLGFRV